MVAALAPQLHLLQSHIFSLLVLDVFADHCFIAPHRRHKVAARPEMLPYKASLPLRVHPRQMDRALALDEPHHLRHSILRWNRNEHVYRVGHHVPFENLTLLLLRFGMNTTWYLHSHFEWLRLSNSSILDLLSCAWRLTFSSFLDGLP